MGEESFKQQLRKKVLELKPEVKGFYSELYNLVEVMIRLNPDAFNEKTTDLLNNKMRELYFNPTKKLHMTLPALERLYYNFDDAPLVRIRSKARLSMSEVKPFLDKVRRDLLFYLALVEDRPKDYGIVLGIDSKK